MKATLMAVAAFTALAAVYLSLSLAILHPPNANIGRWSWMAVLFLTQSTITLLAVTRHLPGPVLRGLLLAGGAVILLIGASGLYATVTGSHFEGYALVLGSALVVQGLLTFVTFGRLPQRVDML